MRIHDRGPQTQPPYPSAERTNWGYDHGTHGHVDRKLPVLDDPTEESRPARDLERELARWGIAPETFLERAWSRLRGAVRDRG